jgi:phosphate butyryltransferase
MIQTMSALRKKAKSDEPMRLVVAAAAEEDVLIAVCKAAKEKLIEPVLVGNIQEMRRLASENHLDIEDFSLISEDDPIKAADRAVELVATGMGDFLMKGLVDTGALMKAVLKKESGLRGDGLLSHVMIYETPFYEKLIFLTDGGMNIAPNYDEKVQIVKNAIAVCRALEFETVKIAALAAKEKVSEKMPATVDAKALQTYCESGGFGKNVILEGPLALDLAVSKEAAAVKKFDSAVSGEVDIFLVPTIEMGNGIGKTLTYLGGASSAGIIMGAKVPIVLTSRADDAEAKHTSIALGSIIASKATF